jgi:DNA-binding transcriptional MerR regulator
MRIGELARRSGLTASRIRFYETEGLLNAVSRKANGYREYPSGALVILGIIVSAQRTGFSLDEIREILPADLTHWRRDELTDILRRKVADIEQMEKRLSQSKKEIRALIRKIEDQPQEACADNTQRLLKEFVPGSLKHGVTASKVMNPR